METTTVPAHYSRTGLARDVSQIVGACVHTSEGGEGDNSAEALALFTSRPRVVDPVTGKAINLASYHAIADTDRVILTVDDARQAYAAGGGNRTYLHICIPGRVSQSREQWLDTVSRSMIRQVAEYITVKGRQYAFPTTKLTVAEVQGGRTKGYCGHRDISQAFKQSTHTDPYPNFPWDVLAADLTELAEPVDAWPPFDPAHAKFSLCPLNPAKPSIKAFSIDLHVRYLKGVWLHHAVRFARWFANSGQAQGQVTFTNPADGKTHTVDRAAALTLGAWYAERLDPNNDAFDGYTHEATLLFQAGFGDATFDGRAVGRLYADAVVGPQTWAFVDSIADGDWA